MRQTSTAGAIEATVPRKPMNVLRTSTFRYLPAIAAVAFGVLSLDTVVDAAQVTGRTAGTFAVTPMGAATYTIPLATPPGPHGVQPHLALVYNSQAGSGYLGVGWALAGLSAITRCNLTYAQDGAAAPVTLTAADGLCLDGQRLRLTSTGNYGQAGSTYQTEIANFSNVTAYESVGSGPQYFVVQTRDGLTYTYGQSGNSLVQGASGTTAVAWLLNEVKDRAGNTMIISYCSSNSSQNPSNCPSTADLAYSNIPASISWTPTTQGGSTYLYTAIFNYSATSVPVVTGYIAGNQQILQLTLNNILLETDAAPFKNYNFLYTPSGTTNRELLSQIQECDGTNANCLAPTIPQYQAGAFGVQSAATLGASATIQRLIPTGDFNGDGRTDLAWYAGGSWYVSFASNSGYTTPVNTGITAANAVVDTVDGTQISGFLAQQSGYWWYYKYTGSSFSGTNTNVPVTSTQASSYALVDVDGDGRPDLVSLVSNTEIDVRLNTSTNGTVSFSSTVTQTPTYAGTTTTVNLFSFSGPAGGPRPSFDGSGRQDLIVIACTVGGPPNYTTTCGEESGLYNGTGLTFTSLLSGGATLLPLDLADVNNDGCADMWGNGQVIYSACTGAAATTANFTYPVLGAFDWNGDGLADVLINYNGYVGVYISNSDAFTFQSTSIPATGNAFVVHNATGDGQDAFGFWSGTTITYYLHNGASQPPDLLSKVTDGYGNYAAPAYSSIVQGSYQNLTDATYPWVNFVGPLYVVSGVTYSDSSAYGPTYTQSYGYYGAWMNMQGRGFAGFDEFSTYDSRNGLYRNRYFQRVAPYFFPYTGMLAADVLSNGSFNIRDTTITPGLTQLSTVSGQQRWYPWVSTESMARKELGGTDNGATIDTTNVALTWDNYGNLLTRSTTVTDNDSNSPFNGQTWTTAITYSPDIDTGNQSSDLAAWCLSVNAPIQIVYSSTATGGTTRTLSPTYTPDTPSNCRIQSVGTAGGTPYAVTETYDYDAFGNVATDTVTGSTMPASPATRVTQYNWGTTGQFLLSKEDPSLATTTWAYGTPQSLSFGVPDSIQDANGVKTQWFYDSFGRKDKEVRPDGTSTVWSLSTCSPSCGWSNSQYESTATQYQSNGSTVIRTDTTLYDPIDRVTQTEGPTVSGTNAIVQQKYLPTGVLYQKTFPFLVGSTSYDTTYTYDALNRVLDIASPNSATDSTIETIKYSYAGRTTTVTDRKSANTTYLVKDVNGWVRQTTDPLGYSVKTTYDAAGSKTLVTDSVGKTLWESSIPGKADCYEYGIAAFLTCATDMSLGAWSYTVDSLGEVTKWTDAKGNTINASYDALSRPLSRSDPDPLVSQWTWGSPATHNAGLLVGECTGTAMGTSAPCTTTTTSPIYKEMRTYDADERLQYDSIALNGNPGNDSGVFLYTYSYDSNTGLLSTLQYPTSTSGTGSPLKLQYSYYDGQLQTVTDTSDSAGTCGTTCTLWSLSLTENSGQLVTQESLGNGVAVNRFYDAVTGALNKATAGTGGNYNLLNQAYAYDADINVSQREDILHGQTENFSYDGNNRLTCVSPTTPCPGSNIAYDGGAAGPGNITSKTDSAGTLSSYSAVWTSYNYPAMITAGGESITFAYGPDRQRWQQVYTNNGATETTYYIGGLMDEVFSGGITDYRHYIYAGKEPIAIYSRKSTLVNSFSYLLLDQQGGIAAITNSSGAAVVDESFTPFGARRNPATWSGAPNLSDLTTSAGITRQGYNFQTTLGNSLGLNHMNGRVQDGVIGRFLSADPVIQNYNLSQSYNRYGYVSNNPVTLLDPTGFDDACPGGTKPYANQGAPTFCPGVPDLGDVVVTASYEGPELPTVVIGGQPPPTFPLQFSIPAIVAPPLLAGIGGIAGVSLTTLASFAPPLPPETTLPEVKVTANRMTPCDQLQGVNDTIQPLLDAATQAYNQYPLRPIDSVWPFSALRGTYIHSYFAGEVTALGPPYSAEVSYLSGVPVTYGTPGSIRADAVVGPVNAPLYAVELKSGAAVPSTSETAAYQANLPPGTGLCSIVESPGP